MAKVTTRQVAQAIVLVAIGVALAPFTSFPVGIAKVNPTQHFVNVLGAVLLGPWWAVANAAIIGAIRNALGVGTPLAFPGGMIGAFLAGYAYRYTRNIFAAAAGEVIGTGIIASLFSGLVFAPVVMGKTMALSVLVLSFLLSTLAGTVVALIALQGLKAAGVVEL